MNIIQTALNRIGYVSQQQIAETLKIEIGKLDKRHRWLGETADAQRWEMPDPQVFANQADLYRLSPILATALDVVAGDLGASKFQVKRMAGEEERDIPNHPFELLLRNPNPLDSGMELMRDTVINYKLNGNSVWWMNKASRYAEIEEIWPIPYNMIEPVPDKRLYLSHYNYHPGGGKPPVRFETWEIVHLKTYNPKNRFVGLSMLESLGVTINGDLAMRKTNTKNYAEHNGAPPSILAFKEYVPDEAWDDVKDEKRQAAKKNEMMMLRGVGDGVTWMSRALSNRDNEYIATLKQNMTDVFNRSCPGLLAMLSENATEANALAARATYSEKTLWVMMETLAQKITSDCLPVYGRKLKGEFDDPRVVDRKLELEEQKQYTLTHTIDQVNAKYYQDEPIGDERGKLFVAQLNAASGGIQEPAVQPMNEQENESEADTEESAQETRGDDLSAKTIDDLMKWRKMALRGKEKAKEFKSDVIPAETMKAIKSALDGVPGKAGIAHLFDAEIERFKPRPQLDPLVILRGIELGVRALEKGTE